MYFSYFSQGFLDDPRNTDNAWVESEAVHVHDTSDFLLAYPLMEPENGANPAWQCEAHRISTLSHF